MSSERREIFWLHTSRPKFASAFRKAFLALGLSGDQAATERLAKAVWDYAADEWSKGYGDGLRAQQEVKK